MRPRSQSSVLPSVGLGFSRFRAGSTSGCQCLPAGRCDDEARAARVGVEDVRVIARTAPSTPPPFDHVRPHEAVAREEPRHQSQVRIPVRRDPRDRCRARAACAAAPAARSRPRASRAPRERERLLEQVHAPLVERAPVGVVPVPPRHEVAGEGAAPNFGKRPGSSSQLHTREPSTRQLMLGKIRPITQCAADLVLASGRTGCSAPAARDLKPRREGRRRAGIRDVVCGSGRSSGTV